jgi:hypothetical protein
MYILLMPNQLWSWSYIVTDFQSATLSWFRAPIWGPWPDFYYCKTFVGFFLWGTLPDKGWICNLLVQLLLSLVSAVTVGSKSHKTHHHVLLSHLGLPQPGGPDPCIYIPQEQVGPVICLGNGLLFCRPLRLAGLRWRYYNPPTSTCRYQSPTNSQSQSQIYLTTDGQSASLSWCQATIRAHDQFFFLLEIFFIDRCGFVILWHPLWWEDRSDSSSVVSSTVQYT